MKNVLYRWREMVLFTLLMTLVHGVFAQGLADFAERLHHARADKEQSSPDFFYDILCAGQQTENLIRSAQADGIQEPADFIHALSDLWCERGEASGTERLLSRIDLPFSLKGTDEKRTVYRNAKALRKQFGPGSSLGRPAFHFFLSVGNGGAQVHLDTAAEGGSDEYVLVLRANRWKVKEFADGGAC